ncbi:HPP family protein [Novosphingobium mangrovi (ex Huang et al. 2023)]|uniref:HPP family protein n=1 Tax=Novosphingobium mangrovi (ex Huang et al. 2023) TaxID=2976432 RepID=A0ABT2I5Y2_9SPHN|nr:HPP family protein [Novosphingobium mangrovi (ex Huang et al. 2023)]MCT2400003.1 HPP family protein [Novosphingobium mangrovi (ex Huang et al. 2023)]
MKRSAQLMPQAAVGHLGWLRGAIGASLGILSAGAITAAVLGTGDPAIPWLVAPMGASAVLVFAVPASPLAQPWAVIVGNLLSSAIGLFMGISLGSPLLAASLGVGSAIAAMSLTRSLHPPGGACALLCALGSAGHDHWTLFILVPVALNVTALAGAGWIYNNLTGHPWPHHIKAPSPAAGASFAYTLEDLEAVLAEWNEMLDVDIDDLDAIFQALHRRVEKQALRRI